MADKVRITARPSLLKLIFFQKVNKKVGQGLASAIETGEKAAGKTKEAVGE
jgi:hypothetical protein